MRRVRRWSQSIGGALLLTGPYMFSGSLSSAYQRSWPFLVCVGCIVAIRRITGKVV